MARVLTDTAAKCGGTAGSPSLPASHARAVRALVRVSSVVKALEETMKSVVAGSASRSTSARRTPSMLETNSQRGAPRVKAESACTAMAGPKSEPPMPLFPTRRKGLPALPGVALEQLLHRHRRETRGVGPQVRPHGRARTGTCRGWHEVLRP